MADQRLPRWEKEMAENYDSIDHSQNMNKRPEEEG